MTFEIFLYLLLSFWVFGMLNIVAAAFKREINHGFMSPWWSGLAWRAYEKRASIVTLLPLNWLLSFEHQAWYWLRVPFGSEGRRQANAIGRAFSQGYRAGFSDGERLR